MNTDKLSEKKKGNAVLHDVMPRYSSIEIDAQKKKIRQNFGTGVDSQYLAELWQRLHKMRGYVSYKL